LDSFLAPVAADLRCRHPWIVSHSTTKVVVAIFALHLLVLASASAVFFLLSCYSSCRRRVVLSHPTKVVAEIFGLLPSLFTPTRRVLAAFSKCMMRRRLRAKESGLPQDGGGRK
jgi:hypothetical protein